MPDNNITPVENEIANAEPQPRKPVWRIVGITMLLLSVIPWFIMPALPFLGFSAGMVAKLTTALFIAAEVLFYSGIAIVGKEFYNKLKPRLNPKTWFKRKGDAKPVVEHEPSES